VKKKKKKKKKKIYIYIYILINDKYNQNIMNYYINLIYIMYKYKIFTFRNFHISNHNYLCRNKNQNNILLIPHQY